MSSSPLPFKRPLHNSKNPLNERVPSPLRGRGLRRGGPGGPKGGEVRHELRNQCHHCKVLKPDTSGSYVLHGQNHDIAAKAAVETWASVKSVGATVVNRIRWRSPLSLILFHGGERVHVQRMCLGSNKGLPSQAKLRIEAGKVGRCEATCLFRSSSLQSGHLRGGRMVGGRVERRAATYGSTSSPRTDRSLRTTNGARLAHHERIEVCTPLTGRGLLTVNWARLAHR